MIGKTAQNALKTPLRVDFSEKCPLIPLFSGKFTY
jgi:hypothetical protein